jgi:hypothetical protein
MRNFARLAAFAAAVLAAVPAGAATMTFSTVLTPDQEVVESGHMHGGQTHGHGGDVRSDAFGAGTLRLTTTGDRFSVAYDVAFNSALDFGFMRTNTPGSEIPADRLNAVSGVHNHAAPRGQNGPVVYGLFNPLQDFFGKPVSLFTARDGTAHLSGAWDSGDGDFEFSKGLVMWRGAQ